MTAIHALITYQNTLSQDSIYHNLIRILLTNLDKICTLPIEQAAELCFTSPASLSRLARTLGYKGYADFRNNLSQAYRNYMFHNRVMPYVPDGTRHPGTVYLQTLADCIRSFSEQCDLEDYAEAARAIHEAADISLFFGEVQDFATLQFQSDMAIDHKACTRLSGAEEQFAHTQNLTDRSIVLLRYGSQISAPHTLSETIRQIRSQHAKLLMIAPTDAPVSGLNADLTLLYPSTRTSLDDYLFEVTMSLLTLAYRTKYIDQVYRQSL